MNGEQKVGLYQERLSAQAPAGHLDLQMDLHTSNEHTHN